VTLSSTFATKLARFHEEQERKRNKPMSKNIRRAVARKLKEQIDAATDPKVIADLANVLAKYLPRPHQPRRKRGAQTPKEVKEPTLNDLVAIMEKERRGMGLTEAEKQLAAAVEKKRKEERKSFS
jgi:hypothetical protein